MLYTLNLDNDVTASNTAIKLEGKKKYMDFYLSHLLSSEKWQ